MKKSHSLLLKRALVLLLAVSMVVPCNGVWAAVRVYAAEGLPEAEVSSAAEKPIDSETEAGEAASDVSESTPSKTSEEKTLDVSVYEDASMTTPLEGAPRVTVSGELPSGSQVKAYVDDITPSIGGVDDSVAGLTSEDEASRAEKYAEIDEVDPLYDGSKTVTLTSLNLGLYDEEGNAMDGSLLRGRAEVSVDLAKLAPEDTAAEVKVYATSDKDEDESVDTAEDEEVAELADAKLSESGDAVTFGVDGAGTYAVVRAARAPRRNAPLHTGFSARELGIETDFFDYDGSSPQSFDSSRNVFRNPDTSGINGNGHRFQFYGNGSPKSQSGTNSTLSINNYTAGEGVNLNGYQYDTSSALQGIVQNQLGEDGYPVLAPGLRWKSNSNDRTSGNESLGYLFDGSSQSGKKSYMGLDGFIQKGSIDGNGQFYIDPNGSYYGYNSNRNYAYYDTSQGNGGNVAVYDDTYGKWNSHTNQFDPNYKIGFFPFNQYNSSNNQVTPWDSKGSSKLNHQNGVAMSATFTMPPDGKVTNADGNKSDMLFSFSGDDDVWVYIDGVLVLDIGGIHQPAGGTINFATGQTTMAGDKVLNRPARSEKVDGAGAVLGTQSTIDQAFANAGKTFDRSPYSTHTIKFFYLERGGNDSNCMLAMNLAFTKATELTVDKDWADGDSLHTASNDSVWVQLYRQVNEGDREPVGEPVQLTKDSTDKYGVGPFRHTFDGLPVRDELNNKIYYTVEEGTLENGSFVRKETEISASGKNYMLDRIEYQYAKGTQPGSDPKTETYRPGDPSTYDAAFHNGNQDPQIGTAVITNRPSTKIEVEKQWRDESGQNADPASHENDSVWVQLYKLERQGGSFPDESQAVAVGNPLELNTSNNWKSAFDVNETDEDVMYLVREGTYDGGTFTPSDRIYAAKTGASDVGQPYQRISTTYEVDQLEQKYKSEQVPGSSSQPFSSNLDYGLHYGYVGGMLHRYIGTSLTGERDDGLISPFSTMGGSAGSTPNNVYWSTRDLVPVRVIIPNDAASLQVKGAVGGDDFNLYREAGKNVSVEGVGSGDASIEGGGNTFTVSFSNDYVASHRGETVTILVPSGTALTQNNNGGNLTWINGGNRRAHINLTLSGTNTASTTTTQTVPDGSPETKTGISSSGGVQFVTEHQIGDNPVTKATTIKGYATIANKPLTTSVSILKRDADTQEGMDGVKFALYRSDSSWVQGQQISEQMTVGGGAATFSGLNDGYYLLKEVKGDANAFYVVPDGFWRIRVQDGGVSQFFDPSGADVATSSGGSYVLDNTKIKTELNVLKKDSGGGLALAGASFTLRKGDVNGKYVNADGSLSNSSYEFTTGSDGKIKVQNLTAGVYWLSETKAPAGYQKLGGPIRIEISNDGTTALFYEGSDQQSVSISNHSVSMTVENSKAPDLPFAGAKTYGLLAAGLCLVGLGVAIAAFARRKRMSM